MKAALFLLLSGGAAFAASATIERRNADGSHRISLEIVDDHPDAIRIDGGEPRRLKYEGTYGSDDFLPTEYFKAGALTVVVGYTAETDEVHYAFGGVTLHGSLEGDFGYHVSDSPDSIRLTSRGGPAPYGRGNTFCRAAADLKDFADADCRVTLSDVYEPRDNWSVSFYALDRESNYASGGTFRPAKYVGEPPSCVTARTCAFYVGSLKYWRKKWTWFAIEIRLRDGLPESALAHDLETYRGRITR